MKILTMPQGSTEWMLARAGVVTASEADELVTPLWKQRTGDGVKSYLYQKLAERVLGYADDGGGTWAMEQGSIKEKICIPWYEFIYETKLTQVGFCLSDDSKIGCSPDALCGEDGGVEIKCPTAKQHLRYLMEGKVPSQYLAQVQFSLYVTGRKWWKFVSFHPHLPALVVHVEPDPIAQAALHKAVTEFVAELDAAHEKIKTMLAAQGGGRD